MDVTGANSNHRPYVRDNPANGINSQSKVVDVHSSHEHYASAGYSTPNHTGAVFTRTCPDDFKSAISSPSTAQMRQMFITGTPLNVSVGHNDVTDVGQDPKLINNKCNKTCVKLPMSKDEAGESVTSSCSPGGLGNNNHGCSLSPASLNNCDRSAGLSTNESIFTYSLTDESQDEADCRRRKELFPSNEVTDTLSNITGVDLCNELTLPPPTCKDSIVKNVIEREYIHRIKYTCADLSNFVKNGLDNDASQFAETNSPQNSKKIYKQPTATNQKEHSHKKFSRKSIKNFLKSMSPGSQHRKRSKDSGSLSSRSSNTLAGSVDSLSINEDQGETGSADAVMEPNSYAKKSPGLASQRGKIRSAIRDRSTSDSKVEFKTDLPAEH